MAAACQQKQAPAYPTEADVDAVIAEAAGDAREAVRMLLSDLDALAWDQRERQPRLHLRPPGRGP